MCCQNGEYQNSYERQFYSISDTPHIKRNIANDSNSLMMIRCDETHNNMNIMDGSHCTIIHQVYEFRGKIVQYFISDWACELTACVKIHYPVAVMNSYTHSLITFHQTKFPIYTCTVCTVHKLLDSSRCEWCSLWMMNTFRNVWCFMHVSLCHLGALGILLRPSLSLAQFKRCNQIDKMAKKLDYALQTNMKNKQKNIQPWEFFSVSFFPSKLPTKCLSHFISDFRHLHCSFCQFDSNICNAPLSSGSNCGVLCHVICVSSLFVCTCVSM